MIIGIIIVIAITFISMPFIFRKSIGHDILGWHKVDKIDSFNGANFHGKCVYCGEDCIQDSQGNWY